jgi:hypothetical protein
MTTDPAPQSQPDPLAYQAPYVPPADVPLRPTVVTVIAVIGIILGIGGLLCKPTSLLMFVVPMPPGPDGQPVVNPVVEAFKNDSFLRLWLIAGTGAGWLISVLLLIASIGSLKLKDWGRTGMLGYAALAALMTIVSQVVSVLALGPALEQAMQQSGAPKTGMMAGLPPAVGMAIGIVLGMWFPVLIFWAFTRPRVKEAFERGLPPAAARI